jgi:hypothetical protein
MRRARQDCRPLMATEAVREMKRDCQTENGIAATI